MHKSHKSQPLRKCHVRVHLFTAILRVQGSRHSTVYAYICSCVQCARAFVHKHTLTHLPLCNFGHVPTQRADRFYFFFFGNIDDATRKLILIWTTTMVWFWHAAAAEAAIQKKNTQQIAIDHFFVFWQIKSNTHIQSRNADLIFFCGFAHGAPEARAEAKWIECRPHFFSFFGMNGVDVICGMLPPRRMQMCPQHKHRACLMWSFRKSFLFVDFAMLFLH